MSGQIDYSQYYQQRSLLGSAADAQNRGENNLDIRGISINELTNAIADHLKAEEGFRSYVYDDWNGKPWSESKVGFPTIGYGHLVKPGENFTTLTEQQASQLLMRDILAHLKPIVPYIKVPLSIEQWVVLTSMAFNVGPGIFRTATFVRLMNENAPLAQIEEAFKRYKMGTIVQNGVKKKVVIRGLENRRNREWAMFAQSVARGDPQVVIA